MKIYETVEGCMGLAVPRSHNVVEPDRWDDRLWANNDVEKKLGTPSMES